MRPITLSAALGTTTIFDVQSGTLTASAALGQITATGDERTSSLTKSGAGTMALTNTNTYSGATLVSGGTLTLSGTGAINTTSGITISGSDAKLLQTSSVASTPGITLTQGTLTGNGTVGAVGVANAVTAIITNNNGVAGASLTTGALTFNGAATVNTFSNSISAPVIAGALSTDLAGTVTINPTAASWITGSTYNLISYTGGSIGGAGFGQFALGTVNGLTGRQFTSGLLTNSGTAVTLAISGYNTIWTGATGTTEWSTNTLANPKNWKLDDFGSTITDFITADTVIFDDSAALKTVDISNGNVSPTSATFNNSLGNDYTVTGSNGIATGSLTKTNTGTVTLSTNNTYTGATTITGGTVNLTGTLGSTAINVGASGTLTETSAGVIGGSASLTTSGTVTLAGNNTYNGITTINAGVLRATTNATALGAGTLTLAGGELQLANNTGLSFGRNTTVTGNAQITSDTLTAVAGVTHTLGTLSIGGQTLTIAKGSNATGTTAGVTFGATTLTGAPTFSIGTDSSLALAAVTNAGNTITLTGAGNFSQTGTLSGVGGLTLNSGFSGTATLSGASTNYSGTTTISGGKLVLSGTTAFASAVTVNAGGTLQYSPVGVSNLAAVGAISLLGTLAYAPAGNAYQVLGTSGANKIVTVSGGASIINISPGGVFAASSGGLYLDGGLQGSSALTVNATTDGFGLALRNAASTYSGAMIVNGTASTAPGTGSGLTLGPTGTALSSADLTINGTLELGDSLSGMGWAIGAVTGTTVSIDALDGSGVVVANMKTAANTRTFSVGSNGGSGNFSGIIANGTNNTLSFTKAGSGTQTLSGLSATAANNYSGLTTIDNGTLAFTTTSPSLTAGLRFGSAAANTTPGILDLTTTNATFAGALLVNTNSATASEIKIGAAQTLTFNGNVQIGATTPAVANTVTKLNMTGGGAFNVTTAAAGTFIVGGSTSTTLSSESTLDLSALASTSVNTSATGTIRVGNNTGTANLVGVKATFILPTPVVLDTVSTATLTAGTLAVGVNSAFNSQAGQINSIQLGTGLTTLNASTINVGTGARDIGQIIFGQAGGDLKIRAADGTSRATLIAVGTGGATTGTTEATTNNLVDFSGHDADILVTSLNVGNQARVGNLISEFKFGEGTGSLASTLDATNVNIGFRTGTATATSILTNRVNLSGGSVTFGNVGASGTGVDIGNSTYNQAGAASTIGELNISGGTVTIYNGSGGYAVRLGSNAAAGGGTVTASMNLTGGTTTLGGDIIRGATSPRTTSTVLISGGTLDMGGHDIGTGSLPITLIAESGELKNVATINGSGGLTKTTGGTLIVSGTNGYTGGTTLTLGNIQIASGSSLGSVDGTLTVTAGTLDLNGNDLGVGNFTGAGGTIVNNSIGTNRTLTIGNNDGTGGNYAGVIADNSGTGGTLALTKTGTGTLTLSNANSYTGGTNINAGSLEIGHANALGTSGTIAFGGGTLKYGTGITADLSGRFSTAASQAYKIDTNGNDVALGTDLASSGGTLTKSGAGKLTIGTSSYTGATTVNGGTLAINGNVSTAVTVNSGGTLGGNGQITGNVSVLSGGTLAAGNSIESLGIVGNYSSAGGTFAYELDNDAAASAAGDLTAVTGDLTFTGTVTLTLTELGSGSWELGNPFGDALTGSPNADKLTLISYGGTWNGGLFTYLGNLVQDDSAIMLNGQQWWFNYNDTNSGTNFIGDLGGATSFVTMTVPEPNVAALIGGMGVLALLRRRRN